MGQVGIVYIFVCVNVGKVQFGGFVYDIDRENFFFILMCCVWFKLVISKFDCYIVDQGLVFGEREVYGGVL